MVAFSGGKGLRGPQTTGTASRPGGPDPRRPEGDQPVRWDRPRLQGRQGGDRRAGGGGGALPRARPRCRAARTRRPRRTDDGDPGERPGALARGVRAGDRESRAPRGHPLGRIRSRGHVGERGGNPPRRRPADRGPAARRGAVARFDTGCCVPARTKSWRTGSARSSPDRLGLAPPGPRFSRGPSLRAARTLSHRGTARASTRARQMGSLSGSTLS